MANYFVWAIVFFVSYLAITQKKNRGSLAIIMFIVLGILSSIIDPKYYFFGFISPDNISVLVVIIVGFLGVKNTKKFKNWSPLQKKAFIFYIILSFLFSIQINIKDVYLFGNLTTDILFKRLFRDFLILFGFYNIIKWSENTFFLDSLRKGFLITIILGALSAVFPIFFESIGLVPSTQFFSNELYGEFARNTGFFGGNANYVSISVNLIAAWSMAMMSVTKKYKNTHLVILLFSFLAILSMASKNAIAVFSLNFLLFIVFNLSFFLKKIYLSGMMIVSFFLLFNFYGETILNRIDGQESGEEDTFSTRVVYWKLYSQNFINHSEYYLFGKNDKVRIHKQNPHNLYIFITYYGGLVFILPILYLLAVFVRYSYRYRKRLAYPIMYCLIAFIVGELTSHGLPNFLFPLLIASASIQYRDGE